MKRELSPISVEQTKEILKGSRKMPPEIVATIGERLEANLPLVAVDAFDTFLESHLKRRHETSLKKTIRTTGEKMLELASTSLLMAWMQAGNIDIPRPRRLGEHNQSVTNVLEDVFGRELSNSHDIFMRTLPVFQDDGKSYAVALDGSSHSQKTHNLAVARNLMSFTGELSQNEKRVIELLMVRDMLGTAIWKYNDKGATFQEVVPEAKREMDALRQELPHDYKGDAERYVDIAYRSDAGAHTQHRAARYVDLETDDSTPDVTDEDRKVLRNGLPMTLDRLFSEDPEHKDRLVFHRPKDLEILDQVLPGIYGDKA